MGGGVYVGGGTVGVDGGGVADGCVGVSPGSVGVTLGGGPTLSVTVGVADCSLTTMSVMGADSPIFPAAL